MLPLLSIANEVIPRLWRIGPEEVWGRIGRGAAIAKGDGATLSALSQKTEKEFARGFNFPAHRNLRVSEGVENLLG